MSAKDASSQAASLVQASKALNTLIELIEQILQRASFLAINATFQASDQAQQSEYGDVAREIKLLSGQIAQANEDLKTRAEKIQSETENNAETVSEIFSSLDGLVERTTSIVSSIEQQRRVASEIDENMSMAAAGSTNVSASVQRLKTTVGEARNTSMQVVTKAVDMADEARRLDTTVKNFLREVGN